MIRFVAAPDGQVVADLKGNLPGRGCWVTARRDFIDKASAKNLFARALKTKVTVPPDLGGDIDQLLVRALTGMMGMARKAGQSVSGAAKVDAAVRSGEAIAVFHASDAAPDGVRKIDQARHAAGRDDVAVFRLLSAQEMAFLGAGGEVIHLATLAGQAGEGVVKRAKMLERYRNEAETGSARETETE